jgi:hypothetical protein
MFCADHHSNYLIEVKTFLSADGMRHGDFGIVISSLALPLHEFATNSTKYGLRAKSDPLEGHSLGGAARSTCCSKAPYYSAATAVTGT